MCLTTDRPGSAPLPYGRNILDCLQPCGTGGLKLPLIESRLAICCGVSRSLGVMCGTEIVLLVFREIVLPPPHTQSISLSESTLISMFALVFISESPLGRPERPSLRLIDAQENAILCELALLRREQWSCILWNRARALDGGLGVRPFTDGRSPQPRGGDSRHGIVVSLRRQVFEHCRGPTGILPDQGEGGEVSLTPIA